jgi:hypothetical protein
LQIENGKIEDNLIVNRQLTLNGMVTGQTTVAPGASFHLYGICCQDLIVSSGATAVIFGTVVGDLINEGVVELRGIIQGNVFSKGAKFLQSPSAIVNGAIEV